MRTDLGHLPHWKQREIKYALGVIFEEFEKFREHASQEWRRRGRILNVVLYGSHARGGWIYDRIRYISDYDLLITVNHEKLLDYGGWYAKVTERFLCEQLAGKLKAPVSIILHTQADVINQLALGRYFFANIVKEGVSLYQAHGHALPEPTPPNPKTAYEEAVRYFASWRFQTRNGLKLARFSTKEAEALAASRRESANECDAAQRDAAFMFHQTVERAYDCFLLVYTLYCPTTHNIGYLRNQCEIRDAALREAWPLAPRTLSSRFNKLKEAYIKARYSPHFRVSQEELEWYDERVSLLVNLVEASCHDRLEQMARDAAAFKKSNSSRRRPSLRSHTGRPAALLDGSASQSK